MILYIQEGDSQTVVHDNTQQLCLWEQLHILMSKQECVQRTEIIINIIGGVLQQIILLNIGFNDTNHNNVNR